jgi:hypothetical protein
LTMDDPAGKRLFDGTNGVLLDAWQRAVRCFRKRTSKPKPSSPSGKPAPSPVRMSSRRQAVAKRKYDPNITPTAIDSPDTSAPAPTSMKTRLRAKSVGVQEDSDIPSDATEVINVEETKRAPEKPVPKPATKPADTSAPAPTMTLQPRTTRLRVKSGGVQEDSDKSSDVTDIIGASDGLAGGRIVKSCSVPGCQKQSRGLRCRGMCQRHFNEGGGKQTPSPAAAAGGGTDAIGGLEANNDLSVSSLASGGVGGRSRNRNRSPRKRKDATGIPDWNDATGIASWRWCRVPPVVTCARRTTTRAGASTAAVGIVSGGGQGGGTTSRRPQRKKKRAPEKLVAKPSAKPSEVPAVEVKTGPPSSKKRRLHPRAAGTSQCGRCDACMVEDCGACTHCKDMKRFGGPGKLKNRCKHRPKCEVKGLK